MAAISSYHSSSHSNFDASASDVLPASSLNYYTSSKSENKFWIASAAKIQEIKIVNPERTRNNNNESETVRKITNLNSLIKGLREKIGLLDSMRNKNDWGMVFAYITVMGTIAGIAISLTTPIPLLVAVIVTPLAIQIGIIALAILIKKIVNKIKHKLPKSDFKENLEELNVLKNEFLEFIRTNPNLINEIEQRIVDRERELANSISENGATNPTNNNLQEIVNEKQNLERLKSFIQYYSENQPVIEL